MMESPERGALMLVRFIALALMGWTVAEVALYWAVSQHNNQPLNFVTLGFKALPFLGGVVILIKARALAEWLADKLDL
jgi:hypothetical protein